MIVIYDLLPCSNYEGLVAVLEVCHLSPPFPWSVPSLRPFVLQGFCESPANLPCVPFLLTCRVWGASRRLTYNLSPCSYCERLVTALGVCRMPPPPLPCSCDVVGAYRFVVCPLPSSFRVVRLIKFF